MQINAALSLIVGTKPRWSSAIPMLVAMVIKCPLIDAGWVNASSMRSATVRLGDAARPG
ncbi:MAG: hypothetical protein JWM76_3871 [Pseudonocardiales bacterium]|nr:hypothetical protein [Pseudonocardiales bacterium]